MKYLKHLLPPLSPYLSILITAILTFNYFIYGEESPSSETPPEFNNKDFCPSALSLENKKLYVIYSDDSQHYFFQIIDTQTIHISETIPIPLSEYQFLPDYFTVLNGNFYLTTPNLSQIYKYEPTKQELTTVVNTEEDSQTKNTNLKYFYADAITNDGRNLYLTTREAILKYDIEKSLLYDFAGESGGNSPWASDGIGKDASFSTPEGITLYGKYLYVGDSLSIRKINIITAKVTTIKVFSTFSDYITTDGKYLYISKNEFSIISKINLQTGKESIIAGKENFHKWADGNGTQTRFNHPESIATDGQHLFIIDTGNCALRTLNLSNNEVKTIFKGERLP